MVVLELLMGLIIIYMPNKQYKPIDENWPISQLGS